MQNDADGDIAAADPFAEESHAEASRQREADEPPKWGDADEGGAGRAGKADMRQRVTREGLTAHHQKNADQSRHHRHDPGGGKCIWS